ncbi:MAG: formate dehydrogenase beta subunit [Pseudomonadales bacterium]
MSTNPLTIYVAADTTARSVGADAVAAAVESFAASNGITIELRRPGSCGLYWLEPMLEVSTEQGRVAYGPVTPADVNSIMAADGSVSAEHSTYLGPTEEIDLLARQDRLTFARVGIIEPLAINQYREYGGFAGLNKALQLSSQQIVDAVKESGLRGRGGAAFPTGIKWQTVLDTPASQKYIVCNADEGDSGTFADRMIMESDPFVLIEGMTIAGLATGATQGYIYTRAEYPQAIKTLNKAIDVAKKENYLGANICNSGKHFELEVREAAGAYICGEETSLLESLEGKRGTIRFRPPLPAVKGLFGQPTVVNNVISLGSVPIIMDRGAEYYRDYGVGRSRGTLTIQLAGNSKRAGLYELPFGVTLREVLYDIGGGTISGRPIRAVQAGGPLGAFVPESQFDTPLDYEAFKEIGAMIGHGGLVVFDDTADMGELARFAMEFCAIESCGKCTPCRVGAVRGMEVIDRIRNGDDKEASREVLRDLCDTMVDGSLCALGGMAPFPVLSVLEHFPEEL